MLLPACLFTVMNMLLKQAMADFRVRDIGSVVIYLFFCLVGSSFWAARSPSRWSRRCFASGAMGNHREDTGRQTQSFCRA
jgi:hypothetical protein